MAIQAVIFDIGGVLVRTEDLEPRRKWERRFGLPEWGLANLVFGNPVAMRAMIGQAPAEAIWAEVARQLSLASAELADLREDFWKGDRLDHDLLAFIRTLRPRYRTGILSNAWPGARRYHQGRLDGDTFDTLVFSAEEGLAKPDPEIYRRALGRLNVSAPEAVFVDDFIENVEAARGLGMGGVHFQPGINVRAEFEKLEIA